MHLLKRSESSQKAARDKVFDYGIAFLLLFIIAVTATAFDLPINKTFRIAFFTIVLITLAWWTFKALVELITGNDFSESYVSRIPDYGGLCLFILAVLVAALFISAVDLAQWAFGA